MSLFDRDQKVFGDIGRLRFSPIAVEKGLGVKLWTDDSRKEPLIDMSASAGAALLGYGHPDVVKAVKEAAETMAGASQLMYPNVHAIELAEALLKLASPHMNGGSAAGTDAHRVWYGHSGSDANDCVFRIVQAHQGAKGRPRIISFIGSYHGNLSGSMSISGHTAMTHTLKYPGLTLLPYPDPYRGYSSQQVLELLEFELATVCPPEQVAAVFIEPILSDGGFIVPPEGFLKKLQDICRSHGALIVLDEVKVGMGRTGKFHCFEHEGLTPDVVVYGKGIGGGLPLSVVVGPTELMNHAKAFVLQTTGGNPVATAAGKAVLDTIAKGSLVAEAERKGLALKTQLEALKKKHSVIGEVRGRGLALGIDFVEPGTKFAIDSTKPAAQQTHAVAKIIYRAYELGLAITYLGLQGNVIEIMPPLTITDAEITTAVELLDKAIASYATITDDQVRPYLPW